MCLIPSSNAVRVRCKLNLLERRIWLFSHVAVKEFIQQSWSKLADK